MSRPDLFMTVARAFAERATCERLHVGAVIVKNKHIISHGYNGAPAGMPQCDEVGCEPGPDGGCIRTIHAEANAIAYAAKVGVNCNGATMYTTDEPCRKCAELILASGIREVVFERAYRLGAYQFLREAGIVSYQHSWEPRA
jgi:dCMP deaminase